MISGEVGLQGQGSANCHAQLFDTVHACNWGGVGGCVCVRAGHAWVVGDVERAVMRGSNRSTSITMLR